jgi:FkbM family methyltransferase
MFFRKALNDMIGHRLKTFRLLCQALGVLGALGVVRARLWGSKTVRVKVKNIAQPILARMNNCDLPTLAEILCSPECEVELSWSPRTILDLGANIGLTAIKLKQQFPQATLIAVEPDPGSADVCRVNLSHMRGAVILQMAIGWGCGAVKCINPEAPSISRRFGSCEADDINAIQEISIREILDQYQCRSPVLIKMDIEGSEASCFEHSGSWLQAVQGVLVEAHSRAVANHITEALSREGFRVTHVGEKLFGERKA